MTGFWEQINFPSVWGGLGARKDPAGINPAPQKSTARKLPACEPSAGFRGPAFGLASGARWPDTNRGEPLRFFTMKFPFATQWSVLGCLVALLAGCATLSPGPTVAMSVVNVRPLQSTLLETAVELTLRLTNESAQPLVLMGSTHKFYFNNTAVGRAVSSERVTVPAFGSATPIVTVYLENLTLLRKATEFSQAPKLVYRLESRLHAADGAAFGDVKATATGELDLAGLGLTPPPAR